MHIHIADAYHEAASPLHRLDARVKVPVALALILCISLAPTGVFGVYVAYFALIMALAVLARLEPGLVLRRSLVALPFAGAAAALIFTVPGQTLARVPLLSWAISVEGLLRFSSIVFKSLLAAQAAVLLLAVTRFTDTLWALGELRMPRTLVGIVSFMLRYLFVLADEAGRMARAREARSASLEDRQRRSILFEARTTGRMIGALIVRSIERSERVYNAMLARGYDGRSLALDAPPLPVRDVIAGLGVTLAAAAILAVSLL